MFRPSSRRIRRSMRRRRRRGVRRRRREWGRGRRGGGGGGDGSGGWMRRGLVVRVGVRGGKRGVGGGRRVRLHYVLNQKVFDSAGESGGRLQEVRAGVEGGQCVVEEYLLGRGGLMERLSIADLSLAFVRVMGGRGRG